MASTTTRPPIPAGITTGGVVAIGRRVRAAAGPDIAAALADGGVRAFELTLNEPEADALRVDRGGRRGGSRPRPRDRRRNRPVDRSGATGDRCRRDVPRDAPPRRGARRRGPPVAASRPSRAARRRPRSSRPGGPAPPRSSSSRRRRWARASCASCAARSPTSRSLPTGGVTLETAPAFIAAGAVARRDGRLAAR